MPSQVLDSQGDHLEVHGQIGVMDNKMESTVFYGGYIGIMDNKMETTVIRRGNIRVLSKMHQAITTRSPVQRKPCIHEPASKYFHKDCHAPFRK